MARPGRGQRRVKDKAMKKGWETIAAGDTESVRENLSIFWAKKQRRGRAVEATVTEWYLEGRITIPQGTWQNPLTMEDKHLLTCILPSIAWSFLNFLKSCLDYLGPEQASERKSTGWSVVLAAAGVAQGTGDRHARCICHFWWPGHSLGTRWT